MKLLVSSQTSFKLLIKEYLKLLRVKEWVKNVFIFLPLFFAGKIFNYEKFDELILGFFAFGLVASSIYIINDYRDMESDRKHPVKSKRPLAAGTVPENVAIVICIISVLSGLLIAFQLKLMFFLIVLFYFILNLGYSFGLKNISILDINIIAIGFILRVKGGGVLASIGVSHWLTIMVFLLALFLAITKRTDDLYLKQSSGIDMRKAIKGYSLEMLNVLLAIVASVIIVAYIMYTISPDVVTKTGTYRLYYTSIFVAAGLFRYLQIIYIHRGAESPTKTLYKDKFIQVVLVLWVLSFYIILYLPKANLFL